MKNFKGSFPFIRRIIQDRHDSLKCRKLFVKCSPDLENSLVLITPTTLRYLQGSFERCHRFYFLPFKWNRALNQLEVETKAFSIIIWILQTILGTCYHGSLFYHAIKLNFDPESSVLEKSLSRFVAIYSVMFPVLHVHAVLKRQEVALFANHYLRFIKFYEGKNISRQLSLLHLICNKNVSLVPRHGDPSCWIFSSSVCKMWKNAANNLSHILHQRRLLGGPFTVQTAMAFAKGGKFQLPGPCTSDSSSAVCILFLH